MSNFSQGKWYLDSANVIRCDDECDRSIAFLYTSPSTKELDEANARLIIAAPEMYETLRELAPLLAIHSYGEDTAIEISKLLARIDGTEAEHD